MGAGWHGFWVVGDIAIGTEASLLPNNVFAKVFFKEAVSLPDTNFPLITYTLLSLLSIPS